MNSFQSELDVNCFGLVQVILRHSQLLEFVSAGILLCPEGTLTTLSTASSFFFF